jgi:hypothetical protein
MADTSFFFPDNTGGTMYVDNGASIDNIFVFAKGADKVRRQPDGRYRAAWRIGNSPSGDQTIRLQAVLNHSSVKDLILDIPGDITIDGTLTIPDGKRLVFQNNCALTGSGTIKASGTGLPTVFSGTFLADRRANIFKGSLTVKLPPEGGKISAAWFGAIPDNSADSYAALQRSIDTCYATGVHSWHLPAGIYQISKGLLFNKWNTGLTDFQFSMNFEITGERKSYGYNSPLSNSFIVPAQNTFGLAMNRGKGFVIKNLGFVGWNTAAQKSNNFYEIMENPSANWTSAGVRDDSFSPHAAIVIDPFSNAATAVGKRYPGFNDFYINSTAGGTTDVVVEDCIAQNFVVAYAITPHEFPQNGDHIRFKGCWVEASKVGWSLGQSQNRTISIRDCCCWGNCEVLVDCRRYGSGQQGTPEIVNMNVAGGVKWMCMLPSYSNGTGITFRDCHFESTWGIGGSFGNPGDVDTSNFINMENCFINLLGSEPGYDIDGCPTIVKCDSVYFTRCYITNLNGGRSRNHSIAARKAVFDKCILENLYVTSQTPAATSVDYIACKWINEDVDTNGRFSTFRSPHEYSDYRRLVVSNFSAEENLQQFNGGQRNVFMKPKTVTSGMRNSVGGGGYFIDLGGATVSAFNNTTKTATFTFTPNSDEVRRLQPGSQIFIYQNDLFGDPIHKHICTVQTVNVGTGVVAMKDVIRTITNGAISGLYYLQHYYALMSIIHGNLTSGSTSVSNVQTNGGNLLYYDGLAIQSPYFPVGTRIVSYTPGASGGPGTLTMSHPANTTVSDVPIEGVPLKREWSSEAPPFGGFETFGWNVGDIIYNTKQTGTHANVLMWVCKSPGSGSSGNTRVSAWTPVYKEAYLDHNTDVDLTGQADGNVLTLEGAVWKPKSSLGAFTSKDVVLANTNWAFTKALTIDTTHNQLLVVGSGALASQRQITINTIAHILLSNFTTGGWRKIASIAASSMRPDNTVYFTFPTRIDATEFKGDSSNTFTGTAVYADVSGRVRPNGDIEVYIGTVTTAPQLSGVDRVLVPVHVSYFKIPASLGTAATPGSFTVAAQGFTTARLTWSGVAGAYGYPIERSLDNITFAPIGVAPAGSTQYDDTGRSPNTQYYYRIAAQVVDYTQSGWATGNVTMPDNTEFLTWAAIDSTMSTYNSNKGIVRDSSGSESWTPKARANQVLKLNDRLVAITDATPKFTVVGLHDNTGGVYGGAIGMRIDQGGGYIRAFEGAEIGSTITVADNEQYSLLYVNDGGFKIKFQYWDGSAWVNHYTMNAPSGSSGEDLYISFFAYSFGAAWKELKIIRG